jgi:hypothetical protein
VDPTFCFFSIESFILFERERERVLAFLFEEGGWGDFRWAECGALGPWLRAWVAAAWAAAGAWALQDSSSLGFVLMTSREDVICYFAILTQHASFEHLLIIYIWFCILLVLP